MRVYEWITRLLPRAFRVAAGPDLDAAARACIARERARRGPLGVALAWIMLAADVMTMSIVTRRDARRHTDSGDGFLQTPRARGPLESFMDNLKKDLLYALRSLRRQPGFTLITIATLALGIGANTAIFSVVNGVLLRPLAYPKPDQLQFVTTTFKQLGFDQFWMSPPEFLEFRDHNTTFQSVGAYATSAVNLGTDPPTRPNGAGVTPEFMPTLGVAPLAGRWFTAEDSRPGANPVTILSSEIWERAYGRDPAILGRHVMIDGVSSEVVGVMPPGYDVHEQKIEVWQPITIPDAKDLLQQRGSHYLYLVGRLKDGVTAVEARADINHMLSVWRDSYAPGPKTHAPDPKIHQVRMDPLKQDIVGGISRALVVLQFAVLFVLVIACANLANLLLARAESRQREFAVRSALGAGRGRMFQQFLTEGLVLAVVASAVGVALAWVAVRGLVALSPTTIPRAAGITLDWRVLGFTMALAVITGVIFGLAPLAQLGTRLAISLRDGTRTSTGTRRALRSGLVVVEVALAVTLVAGAGLLLRSFANLVSVDAGFNRSHLVTFGVVPPVLGNPKTDAERQARRQHFVDLFEQMRARLAALPGVDQVTSMSGLPPNRPVLANDTDFEWIPNMPGLQAFNGETPYPVENVDYWQYVGQHFLDTLGVPIVKGRGFEAGDVAGAPVVLVNEALVRKFFKGRDPIGEHLKPGYGNDGVPWFTVVGVLKDVKQGGMDAPAGTEIYLFEDQLARFTYVNTDTNFVLRTTAPIDSLARPIRQVVHDLDPTLPIVKLQTMDDVFGESVARPKFLTTLLGIFAALALALAAVGTYGILSYLVTERAREIGIRMALGAGQSSILRDVLSRGLTLTAAGLAAGLAAAIALTRLMRTMLFNVTPNDPVTLVTVTGVIAIVAVAACLLPAWRATRVDPLIVLRES